MNGHRQTNCRCCGGAPLIGYFGLCRTCADAVNRFIALRRANFKTRASR